MPDGSLRSAGSRSPVPGHPQAQHTSTVQSSTVSTHRLYQLLQPVPHPLALSAQFGSSRCVPRHRYQPGDIWRGVFCRSVWRDLSLSLSLNSESPLGSLDKRSSSGVGMDDSYSITFEGEGGEAMLRRFVRLEVAGLSGLLIYEIYCTHPLPSPPSFPPTPTSPRVDPSIDSGSRGPTRKQLTLTTVFGDPDDPEDDGGMEVDDVLDAVGGRVVWFPVYACTSFIAGQAMHAFLVDQNVLRPIPTSDGFSIRCLRDNGDRDRDRLGLDTLQLCQARIRNHLSRMRISGSGRIIDRASGKASESEPFRTRKTVALQRPIPFRASEADAGSEQAGPGVGFIQSSTSSVSSTTTTRSVYSSTGSVSGLGVGTDTQADVYRCGTTTVTPTAAAAADTTTARDPVSPSASSSSGTSGTTSGCGSMTSPDTDAATGLESLDHLDHLEHIDRLNNTDDADDASLTSNPSTSSFSSSFGSGFGFDSHFDSGSSISEILFSSSRSSTRDGEGLTLSVSWSQHWQCCGGAVGEEVGKGDRRDGDVASSGDDDGGSENDSGAVDGIAGSDEGLEDASPEKPIAQSKLVVGLAANLKRLREHGHDLGSSAASSELDLDLSVKDTEVGITDESGLEEPGTGTGTIAIRNFADEVSVGGAGQVGTESTGVPGVLDLRRERDDYERRPFSEAQFKARVVDSHSYRGRLLDLGLDCGLLGGEARSVTSLLPGSNRGSEGILLEGLVRESRSIVSTTTTSLEYPADEPGGTSDTVSGSASTSTSTSTSTGTSNSDSDSTKPTSPNTRLSPLLALRVRTSKIGPTRFGRANLAGQLDGVGRSTRHRLVVGRDVVVGSVAAPESDAPEGLGDGSVVRAGDGDGSAMVGCDEHAWTPDTSGLATFATDSDLVLTDLDADADLDSLDDDEESESVSGTGGDTSTSSSMVSATTTATTTTTNTSDADRDADLEDASFADTSASSFLAGSPSSFLLSVSGSGHLDDLDEGSLPRSKSSKFMEVTVPASVVVVGKILQARSLEVSESIGITDERDSEWVSFLDFGSTSDSSDDF